MFHTRIDILMMGCLVAFLLDSPSWRQRIRKIPVAPVLLASSIFLLMIEPSILGHRSAHSLLRAATSAILPTIEAAAIAAAILILIAGKAGIAQAVLNQPAVMHIGKLSYSLYIWQQLFLSPGTSSKPLSLLCRILLIYVVALCSFNFVEKPFLSLRKRFRRVQSE